MSTFFWTELQPATRDAIIKALEDLKTFNIKKGEPILVYYAGLGGEICPDILSTTLGYVVPQDFAKSAKHDVSVISHREIASLLSDLAMISGDNIVSESTFLFGLELHCVFQYFRPLSSIIIPTQSLMHWYTSQASTSRTSTTTAISRVSRTMKHDT